MFLFRIDLGSKFGLGHYQRVKSLIKYLKIKNYKIVIDNICDSFFLQNHKKNINILYENKKKYKDEKNDARLFLKIVKKERKEVFVIKDSYRLGYLWEKTIAKHVKKIIVIDDKIEQKHFADFYINHSPRLCTTDKNDIKLLKENNKKNCIFLLGTNYALFNSNYSNKKELKSDIIFYNGGSGNILIYKKILNNLIKIKKKLKIILIIGPYSKKISSAFKSYKNLIILENQHNILNYLASTKLFISSAGISMFESSYLKVPSLLFKMNENQNLSDTDYENLGHYFCLEKSDLKNTTKIVKLINLMLNDLNMIKKLMQQSKINLKIISQNYYKNLIKKL